MTNPYKMFKTDKDLEAGKGIDLDYGDFSITIHRAGGANQKYSKVASVKLKPLARQIQNGTADPEAVRRAMAEIYAEAVIIGWKGVRDEKDAVMKFSKENCVKFLVDLPDLFDDIQREADRVSNFRSSEIEADAKNSSKS